MRKVLMVLVCLAMPIIGLAGQNESAKQDELWITVGTDAMNIIRAEFEDRLWKVFSQRHRTNPDISMMRVTEAQMVALSKLLHHEFGRCGGFVVHPSYEKALASAHRELSNPGNKMALSYTLDRAAAVNAVMPDLAEQNIVNSITTLENFNTRYYTTQSSVDSANWLKTTWEGFATGRSDITVELYNHSGWLMPSVVLTITGAHQPQDIVVMGGHLDSINSSGTLAPGADDDASGIATLTEILRAALAQGYTPSRTIKVIGYAAEEVGLRGSGEIADDAVANGDNVIGVLQLDMTNYQGSSQDIYLMQDYTNAAQNTFVSTLIDTYTSHSWATSSCGYGCSDHASWHNRGFPASMPFESTINQYNPNIHTANDTISVSGNGAAHAIKFARMGLAYLIEMGKGGLNGNPGTDPGPVGGGGNQGTEVTNPTTLSNLSGTAGGEDRYYIDVPAGATNLQISTSGGSGDVDLYTRFGVAPTTTNWDCRPYAGGNNESCPVASPSQGTYFIMLRGYSTYSGVTLSVSFDAPGNNNPPSAGFTAATNNLSVAFTDTSSDSDGSISTWSWTFGDGATSNSQNPNHTYATDGTYTVSLTVTDNDGATDNTSQSVAVTSGGGGSWVELASDNFESGWGSYVDGGSDCRRSINDSAYAHQGSYCARLRDDTSTSVFTTAGAIALSGKTEMKVDFWFYPRSMENGEDLFLEYNAGSGWTSIGNWVIGNGSGYSNDNFYSESVTIDSGGYSFNNSAQIRFRCDASGNSDYVYIDEVVVSAR